MKNKTRVMLQGKVSYLHCFQPYSFSNDKSNAKYMATLLIPKEDAENVKKAEAAIDAAIEKGKEELWQGKSLSNLNLPLKDGDQKDGDNKNDFKDNYYIIAKNKQAPEIVDQKLNPIIEENSGLYSGCIVNMTIQFTPYLAGGNKGVSAVLGNIQLVRQETHLDRKGRIRAEDDFSVIEDEEDEYV